jgi:hypothetical protein
LFVADSLSPFVPAEAGTQRLAKNWAPACAGANGVCQSKGGAHYFEKIVESAMKSPDIWVGTRAQIADHVLARNAA